jgi:hypothetical protein
MLRPPTETDFPRWAFRVSSVGTRHVTSINDLHDLIHIHLLFGQRSFDAIPPKLSPSPGLTLKRRSRHRAPFPVPNLRQPSRAMASNDRGRIYNRRLERR